MCSSDLKKVGKNQIQVKVLKKEGGDKNVEAAGNDKNVEAEVPSVSPRGDRTEAENKKFDEMSEAKGFNKGGPVPGSGNKDTVPAMLTPGEFVMSKGAVQKYGEDTLAAMNSMGGETNCTYGELNNAQLSKHGSRGKAARELAPYLLKAIGIKK